MTGALIALVAAAVVLLTGSSCGSSATQDTSTPARLEFTATTVNGQQFSGESLHGKPAVLWFWAPWCPTCQREAPTVAKVAAANPAVTFVGVAGRAETSATREFVDKYRVNGFTQLADADGAVWTKFGVTRQPAFAFVSKDGHLDLVKGDLSEAQLAERVSGLAEK